MLGTNKNEQAFAHVVRAIRSKSHSVLFEISDPIETRDPRKFDEQARALFSQFARIELVNAPFFCEFDGLAALFGKFRVREKEFIAPFVFHYTTNQMLKFLPYRTERLSYVLVSDWFNQVGQFASGKDAYCSEESVKSATHEVSVETFRDPAVPTIQSKLLLTGVPFDTRGRLSVLASRIMNVINAMKFSLAKPSLDDFVQYLTPEGASRLTAWFSNADPSERAAYKKPLMEHTPFFFFDASPLLVVYTSSPDHGVQVMYFTINSKGELLWTNSSHVTAADKVFKKGALYRAALEASPFSSVQIK